LFDGADSRENKELSPEDEMHFQLRKFVINPFADRISNVLNDIFSTLNLETCLKDLKEAKKNKRTHKKHPTSLSAQKQRTPVKQQG
jgi:hypothetical protein